MSISIKLVIVALICMAVSFGEAATPVTCGGVVKSLGPCMPYLRSRRGQVGAPPVNCCGGVRALKAMAQTTADRRTACVCMKNAAGKMKDLNYGNAAKLPGQCGVTLSYIFSPNINCNTVQ